MALSIDLMSAYMSALKSAINHCLIPAITARPPSLTAHSQSLRHIHIFLSERVEARLAPIPAIRSISTTRVHFVCGLSTLLGLRASGRLHAGHRFRRPILARDQFAGKNCDDLKKRKPAEAGFRKVKFC